MEFDLEVPAEIPSGVSAKHLPVMALTRAMTAKLAAQATSKNTLIKTSSPSSRMLPTPRLSSSRVYYCEESENSRTSSDSDTSTVLSNNSDFNLHDFATRVFAHFNELNAKIELISNRISHINESISDHHANINELEREFSLVANKLSSLHNNLSVLVPSSAELNLNYIPSSPRHMYTSFPPFDSPAPSRHHPTPSRTPPHPSRPHPPPAQPHPPPSQLHPPPARPHPPPSQPHPPPSRPRPLPSRPHPPPSRTPPPPSRPHPRLSRPHLPQSRPLQPLPRPHPPPSRPYPSVFSTQPRPSRPLHPPIRPHHPLSRPSPPTRRHHPSTSRARLPTRPYSPPSRPYPPRTPRPEPHNRHRQSLHPSPPSHPLSASSFPPLPRSAPSHNVTFSVPNSISSSTRKTLLVLGDSNTKYIRFPNTGHHRIPTYTIEEIDPNVCIGYTKIWIHVGINNLKSVRCGGPDDVQKSFKLFMHKIERIGPLSPDTTVIISPILPTGVDILNERAGIFNELLFSTKRWWLELDFSIFANRFGMLDKYFRCFGNPKDKIHLGANGIRELEHMIASRISLVDVRSYSAVVQSNST